MTTTGFALLGRRFGSAALELTPICIGTRGDLASSGDYPVPEDRHTGDADLALDRAFRDGSQGTLGKLTPRLPQPVRAAARVARMGQSPSCAIGRCLRRQHTFVQSLGTSAGRRHGGAGAHAPPRLFFRTHPAATGVQGVLRWPATRALPVAPQGWKPSRRGSGCATNATTTITWSPTTGGS